MACSIALSSWGAAEKFWARPGIEKNRTQRECFTEILGTLRFDVTSYDRGLVFSDNAWTTLP
jgi:hypothetical protein